MKNKYEKTIYACFIAYIVQAIVNNFVPLLLLMFHSHYGIPMEKITLLITFNFGLQLFVDISSVYFADQIGYRASMILAHICSSLGFISLTILPEIMDPFIGLLISISIYAVGGGLLEVLLSPIVEACPTDNKEMVMSLLHSFYCWGHMGVVLISTLFFFMFGIENWKIMSLIWAIVPFCNMFLFIKVPIAPLVKEGETGLTLGQLSKSKTFWLFMLMMLCAGASEQSVGQWASTLAQAGLGVSKTIGDLAGPMFFACLMGISRAFYGKYGDKLDLDKFMMASSILCMVAYISISLIPNAVIGLLGCGLCGLSVGIMWPGVFSKASASIHNGGTAMFALLALGGDIGCMFGPSLVGFVSSGLHDNLKLGILAGIIFPILLFIGIKKCHKCGTISNS